MTAEFDPLRDGGEAYAARLRAAGVPARVARNDGLIHGFWWMAGALDRSKQAYEGIGEALREALAPA